MTQGPRENKQRMAGQALQQDRFNYEPGNYSHKPTDYSAEALDTVGRYANLFDNSKSLQALDERINRRSMYQAAKADVQTASYLGDVWSYKPPKFQFGGSLPAVKGPDVEGLMDKAFGQIGKIKPEI